jgi:hypothetical protein
MIDSQQRPAFILKYRPSPHKSPPLRLSLYFQERLPELFHSSRLIEISATRLSTRSELYLCLGYAIFQLAITNQSFITISIIPPMPDPTTRPPLPEPPAPSLHPLSTHLSPTSPTNQEPSMAHALLAPSASLPTNQSTNAGTSSTTGIAHNAPHTIPPAVTFSSVPYVDTLHSVFYQAGGDIHIYLPTNGVCTLLIYILYSHLIDQCSIAFAQLP